MFAIYYKRPLLSYNTSLSQRFIHGRLSTQMYRQISVCLMWMWLTHFNRSTSEHFSAQEDQEMADLADARLERIESDMLYNEQAR